MNYAIFLSILNLILVARLRLIFRDDGATIKDLFIIGIFPLLSLPFLQLNWSWVLLVLYFIGRVFAIALAERNPAKRNRNRALSMLMDVVVLAVLCSPLLYLRGGWLAGQAISFLGWMFIPEQPLTIAMLVSYQFVLAGFLLVINEMNIILRYILRVMGLQSVGKQEDKVSDEEYSMGRLIGLLERIFIFLFVLVNQYGAIGFILAAKGVTRFNNFKDDRPFAEYVLIGTLLSTLLALMIGWGVKVAL